MGIKWIAASPLHTNEFYPGFNPASKTLPKGLVYKEGHLPLPCNILLEQDLEVSLCDGTQLYADVYRPPQCSTWLASRHSCLLPVWETRRTQPIQL